MNWNPFFSSWRFVTVFYWKKKLKFNGNSYFYAISLKDESKKKAANEKR